MTRIFEILSVHKPAILEVINEAACAYQGIIPDDRWKEPYMSAEELDEEVGSGVRFYGWIKGNTLLGVAGIQHCGDVDLIRHCYVSTDYQGQGIGSALLRCLLNLARASEVLVGTWEDATWAIRFYERYGFVLVSNEEKDRLLQRYWTIPERQIDTSVVLRHKGP
jgi:GNAT superfamily N-acetyltransferase